MALEDNHQQPNLNEDRVKERVGMHAGQLHDVVLPVAAGNPLQPPMQYLAAQRQRTVRDYLEEDLDRYNSAIVMPKILADRFELTFVMFNMLHTIGKFGRSINEDAQGHIKSFLELCNSFKMPNCVDEILKLKLFPYSLMNKAKI